jgi:hypothetical protein
MGSTTEANPTRLAARSSSGPCALTRTNNLDDHVVNIDIATAFSAYPAGRDDNDGPYNGQKFQREILIESMKRATDQNVKVIVSLNGLRSCGSSFLEEAFGGLIRDGHFKKRQVEKSLEVVYSSQRLKRWNDAIYRYIKEAKPAQ